MRKAHHEQGKYHQENKVNGCYLEQNTNSRLSIKNHKTFKMTNKLQQTTRNKNENKPAHLRGLDLNQKNQLNQIEKKQQEDNKQLASVEFQIQEAEHDLANIESEIYKKERQRELVIEEIYEINKKILLLKDYSHPEELGHTNQLGSLIKNRENYQKESDRLRSIIHKLRDNRELFRQKISSLTNKQKESRKEFIHSLEARIHLTQQTLESMKLEAHSKAKRLQEIETKIHQAQTELQNTLNHEKSLNLNFTKRNRELQGREKRLSEQERAFSEHLAKQRQEFDALRAEELAAIKNTQEQIKKTRTQLELDRERLTKEFQDHLEKTSANYINQTLNGLKTTHESLIDSADTWRELGAIALLVGFCILLYASYRANPLDPSLSWLSISYISLRGSALLLLVGAFTTYAAKTSASRSEEAEIIADRIHAIEYGAFYLNTYGANASWEQIDSAFRHWHGNDNKKRDADPEKRKPRIRRAYKSTTNS